MTEVKLAGEPTSPRIAGTASSWRRSIRWIARFDAHDIATVALLAALAVLAAWTFKDYAISNDEGVQHHYGELIVAYYASGLSEQSVFGFLNLYLYGGLFDTVAVLLSRLVPIDPYDLRHILCALIGIGGIGAAAATARRRRSAAALIAAAGLACGGAWYGAMFNHTKDIPFAAAMTGATLFLIRIARACPRLAPATWRRSASWRGRARHAGVRSAAGGLRRLRDRPVHAAAGRPSAARAGVSWSHRRWGCCRRCCSPTSS